MSSHGLEEWWIFGGDHQCRIGVVTALRSGHLLEDLVSGRVGGARRSVDGDEASGSAAGRASGTGGGRVVRGSAALLGDNAGTGGSALGNGAQGGINGDVDSLAGSDSDGGSGSAASSISSAGASSRSTVACTVSSDGGLLAPEAQVRASGSGRNSDGVGGGAGGRQSGRRGGVRLVLAVTRSSGRGRGSRGSVDGLGLVGGRGLVDSGGNDRLGRATANGVGKSHISGEGGVGSDSLGSSGTSRGGRGNTRAVSATSEGSVGVDARVSRDTSAQGSNDRAGSSAGLDGSDRALVGASGERNGNRGSLNGRSDGSDNRRARNRGVGECRSSRGLVEVAIVLTLVLSSVCADCQGGGHEGRAEVHDG